MTAPRGAPYTNNVGCLMFGLLGYSDGDCDVNYGSEVLVRGLTRLGNPAFHLASQTCEVVFCRRDSPEMIDCSFQFFICIDAEDVASDANDRINGGITVRLRRRDGLALTLEDDGSGYMGEVRGRYIDLPQWKEQPHITG